MRKLTKILLATTFGAIPFIGISMTAAFAQSDQGGPSDNGLPGQPPEFQRPYGSPEGIENGPRPGSPLGNVTPGRFNQQPGGPPQWQAQGQPDQGPGEGPSGQGRPWGGDGQGSGLGRGQGNPGGRGQWGGGQGMSEDERAQRRARMLKMFDKNGDGQLDDAERAQMRAYMAQRRQQRVQREAQGGGGGGGFNNGQPPN